MFLKSAIRHPKSDILFDRSLRSRESRFCVFEDPLNDAPIVIDVTDNVVER
jgi:hypothetical protein